MITDVLVIGGGPAGLAAAISAAKSGVRVTLVERKSLGGILQQCIHSGFGLEYFGKELTGPEYANEFINQLPMYPNIEVISGLATAVNPDLTAEIVSKEGCKLIRAKAIVLSTGCREKPRGMLDIAGTRPAGIFTAGTAQELINIYGRQVGKAVVVLGSGDIGLIMARRLTFEGAKVLKVLEIQPNPSGLNRNISQCLGDFGIPLELSTTVIEVIGKSRVEAVVTARVDENLKPIAGTETVVPCDTLILSVGLIPENDIAAFLPMSGRTKGAIVDSCGMTEHLGIFACGNASHVHDIVDEVTNEAQTAGKNAAIFSKTRRGALNKFNVNAGENVAYVVPQRIVKSDSRARLYIKPKCKIDSAVVTVSACNVMIKSVRKFSVSPNETVVLPVPCQSLTGDVTVTIKSENDIG